MTNYLQGMYNLQPIDFVKLNKEKVLEIYDCSDIDTWNYLLPFCKGKIKTLCEEVINLNETEIDSEIYIKKKWELLESFGFEKKFGDIFIKK